MTVKATKNFSKKPKNRKNPKKSLLFSIPKLIPIPTDFQKSIPQGSRIQLVFIVFLGAIQSIT
jgi:hypothetical protein